MTAFKSLKKERKEKSKVKAMDFRKADLIELRTPWMTNLSVKGIQ